VTDDDKFLTDARIKRRRLKYGRMPTAAIGRDTNSSALGPRRNNLVLQPWSVTHDIELFFLLNADYFAKKR